MVYVFVKAFHLLEHGVDFIFKLPVLGPEAF